MLCVSLHIDDCVSSTGYYLTSGKNLSVLFLHLPILRYPMPDGVLPVFVQVVSPRRVSKWWYAKAIGYLVFCCMCSDQVHFRLLTCSVTSVNFIFWCLTYFFQSLFVRLEACSLSGWWVSMFPHPMSLLAVRTSCRFVFSSMSRCYPWKCRDAWAESRPSGCDSSLNLLALVVVSGAVPLPLGDVAFNVLYTSSVGMYWCFVAVNSLGDTMSAGRTPLLVLILLLSWSPKVDLRRGCGLLSSIRFRIQFPFGTCFRRVSFLAFLLVLSWVVYRHLKTDIPVCISWCLSYFPSYRLSSSSSLRSSTLWVFVFLISI